MTDEERSKIMDNLIAQDADLIDVDGRIAELEEALPKVDSEPSPYCPVCGSCGDEGCCGEKRCLYPDAALQERIAELEREKVVVSDLLEQQKELALEYLFDCNRAGKRIAELEAALSWSLIQLGSETGYSMEGPIWQVYDRARDVLNGVKK